MRLILIIVAGVAVGLVVCKPFVAVSDTGIRGRPMVGYDDSLKNRLSMTRGAEGDTGGGGGGGRGERALEMILGLVETIAAGTGTDGVPMWAMVGVLCVRGDEDGNNKCGEDAGVLGEGEGEGEGERACDDEGEHGGSGGGGRGRGDGGGGGGGNSE